ncbi:DNA translocase SftA [Geobacillus sp. BCO2]|nr:DNA translocase SftA [Geobacillus sp. BCO2]
MPVCHRPRRSVDIELQRHFRIGYNRAARLIEMMEQQGLISEARGSKPRDVLMSEDEWERWREQNS